MDCKLLVDCKTNNCCGLAPTEITELYILHTAWIQDKPKATKIVRKTTADASPPAGKKEKEKDKEREKDKEVKPTANKKVFALMLWADISSNSSFLVGNL